MNLRPLANLIEKKGVATLGVDLFMHMMPPEASNAILLRNRLIGTKIDYELPGYYTTKFYMVVRATDYSAGDPGGIVEEAVKAITLGEGQLESMKVNYIRPKHLPVVFPLSNGDLLEYNVEFEACFVV